MNDRSLADLLLELDAELSRRNDPDHAAGLVLSVIDGRVSGSVARYVASAELSSVYRAHGLTGL